MSDGIYNENELLYLPEPPRPADFDKRFAEVVGESDAPNGKALRVVWCMDHREMFQGKMEIKYIDPNGVYLAAPYYALEGWQPPTVYDRSEWEQNRYGAEVMVGHFPFWDKTIDALGPFPEDGVWDFLCFIRNDDMTFAPIEKALEKARAWRYHREQNDSKARIVTEYKAYMLKKAAAKKAAMAEFSERRQAEHEHFIKQEVPHSDNPTVEVPSNYGQGYTKNELARLNAQGDHLLGGNAVPVGASTITPSGLIVKKSALDN